ARRPPAPCRRAAARKPPGRHPCAIRRSRKPPRRFVVAAQTGTQGMKPQNEHLPLDALVPYARNSRTHRPEQIAQVAASIREFGFTNPVLMDGEGGISAGHGRVMAARQLGLSEVPCIRLAPLTGAQKRAYVIADNKLARNAGWDDALLALELRDLGSEGFALHLTGFSDEELDNLLDID